MTSTTIDLPLEATIKPSSITSNPTFTILIFLLVIPYCEVRECIENLISNGKLPNVNIILGLNFFTCSPMPKPFDKIGSA